MLLENFTRLLVDGGRECFAQTRTLMRSLEHSVARTLLAGRRTVSNAITFLGRAQQDWSSDYKLFSRSSWCEDDLFDPVIADLLREVPDGPIPAGIDDTRIRKTGRKIPMTSWGRDPLSPPFRYNLQWALRTLQISFLCPHYRKDEGGARAYPMLFRNAPVPKKPGRSASEEEKQDYKRLRREASLPAQARQAVFDLRERLDRHGAAHRRLLLAGDGGFCNRSFFKAPLDRVDLIARCRSDAALYHPADPGTRRKYGVEAFTPEQVRLDEAIKWRHARIFYGGKRRRVDYKEVRPVLWKGGAGARPLRLIVIRPTAYKNSKNGRVLYRAPAYLLTTDLESSAVSLLQVYFDRWQIEVNFREEKSLFGIGDAQVRSALSVPRQPAFAVATYSTLIWSGHKTFAGQRSDAFPARPKWYPSQRRPSAQDYVNCLHREWTEKGGLAWIRENFQENRRRHAIN